MTNASGGVAVIATRLAQTDRRALSEAWYAALHLTRAAEPLRPPGPRANALVPLRLRAMSGGAAHAERAGIRAVPARRASERAAADPSATPAGERRRAPSETGRRIGRAVAQLGTQARVSAAHTIDVDGGRVRLLVHHDGRTTRIVALCSGPLREQVERALASARFTLAGAGFVVGAP